MRSPNLRIASGLFAASAVAPLPLWYILLFVAKPAQQSASEHALSQLVYSFTESGAPWHFLLLAVLPVAFLVLAVTAWRERADSWRFGSWPSMLALSSTVLVALVLWEVVLFAAPAVFMAVRHGDG